MGRGVASHPNAVETVYLHLDEEMDPDGGWDDFLDAVREVIRGGKSWGTKIAGLPSFEEVTRWVGRETHAILENGHAQVCVSQYLGVVAVDLVPLTGPYDAEQPLAQAWCRQVAGRFRDLLYASFPEAAMQRQGVMSNGVSVYQLVNAPGSCVTGNEGRLW
jgi:hypothetical protein